MNAAAWLLLLAGLAQSPSSLAEERRNWFDDPFFQVSFGLEGCPAPLGPLLTQDEQRREAHYRAERGTSCWLSGQCRESNAYRYDRDLAPQVAAALKTVPGIERSSVWVTIQRRWVFLEGCVASVEQIALLESAARAVPEVEIVVPALNIGVSGPPRYQLAPR
jgi:BON domain